MSIVVYCCISIQSSNQNIASYTIRYLHVMRSNTLLSCYLDKKSTQRVQRGNASLFYRNTSIVLSPTTNKLLTLTPDV